MSYEELQKEREYRNWEQDEIREQEYNDGLLNRLHKSGITTEQLEKLASGDAWVAEFVLHRKGLVKEPVDFVLCANSYEPFISDYPEDIERATFVVTFNGCFSIPYVDEDDYEIPTSKKETQ